MRIQYFLVTLLNIVFGAIVFVLALRIILRMFGANPTTPFVSFVYTSSESVLTPFRGIFPTTEIVPGSVFDIPAFIAIIVYGLVFYLIAMLLNMIVGSMFRSDERVISEEHIHSRI